MHHVGSAAGVDSSRLLSDAPFAAATFQCRDPGTLSVDLLLYPSQSFFEDLLGPGVGRGRRVIIAPQAAMAIEDEGASLLFGLQKRFVTCLYMSQERSAGLMRPSLEIVEQSASPAHSLEG